MDSIANLNAAADAFLVTDDKEALLYCMKCTLSDEKFLRCIHATKRYDLLPRVEHALEKLFIYNCADLIYNLYIDLLILDSHHCATIRSKCSLDKLHICELMAQRNLNIFSINRDFTNQQLEWYFRSVIREDNFDLFLQLESVITVKLGEQALVDTLIAALADRSKASSPVLSHLCAKGMHRLVASRCLYKLTREHRKEGYTALLREICAQHDCRKLLSREFSWEIGNKGKDVYTFLLSLGARPSDEQKEKLRADNPRLYREIFSEDV